MRLARWLRLLGADVIAGPELHGAALLAAARAEGRILLTRDKRLRTAPETFFIESNFFREQLTQVLKRFPFDLRRGPFTRCSLCNELLHRVDRELIARRVPPFVFATNEAFAECDSCGRIYWAATHPERALSELRALAL